MRGVGSIKQQIAGVGKMKQSAYGVGKMHGDEEADKKKSMMAAADLAKLFEKKK